MTIQSFQLDPNAQSYSDDEIVGKVNSASADITRAGSVDADALFDGTTNRAFTETDETKLAGIAGGAEVNPADLAELDPTQNTKLNGIEEGADVNPTDDEVVTSINSATTPITREAALSQDDLKVVKTNPAGGEFLVKNIQRDSAGKLDIEYDDVAQ